MLGRRKGGRIGKRGNHGERSLGEGYVGRGDHEHEHSMAGVSADKSA